MLLVNTGKTKQSRHKQAGSETGARSDRRGCRRRREMDAEVVAVVPREILVDIGQQHSAVGVLEIGPG